jgi:hypothetical protein
MGIIRAIRLYLQRPLLVMLTRIHRLKKHILSILKEQNRRGRLKGEVSQEGKEDSMITFRVSERSNRT